MQAQDFVAEMEVRFGSDEALGVQFRLDSGETLSLAQYDSLTEGMRAEDIPGAESLLPDGGSAVCCTDYASYIFNQLPGRVRIYGFANEDNPTSRVAREEIHPGGHDFAVVDERYIVDPWPRLVPGVLDQMVFDLTDPKDQALALDVYGPRTCWTHMALAEEFAKKRCRNTF